MMGECVNLSWNVTGSTTGLSLSRDGQMIGSGLKAGGQLTGCPAYGGSILYTLVTNGAGGTANSNQTLQVAEPR